MLSVHKVIEGDVHRRVQWTLYAGTYHPIDTSALLCLVLASSSDTRLIIVGQILKAVPVIQLVLITNSCECGVFIIRQYT